MRRIIQLREKPRQVVKLYENNQRRLVLCCPMWSGGLITNLYRSLQAGVVGVSNGLWVFQSEPINRKRVLRSGWSHTISLALSGSAVKPLPDLYVVTWVSAGRNSGHTERWACQNVWPKILSINANGSERDQTFTGHANHPDYSYYKWCVHVHHYLQLTLTLHMTLCMAQ